MFTIIYSLKRKMNDIQKTANSNQAHVDLFSLLMIFTGALTLLFAFLGIHTTNTNFYIVAFATFALFLKYMILANQGSVLLNQEKFLANQEKFLANQEKFLANQEFIKEQLNQIK